MQVLRVLYVVLILFGVVLMLLGTLFFVMVLFGAAMTGERFLAALVLGALGILSTSIGAYQVSENSRYYR